MQATFGAWLQKNKINGLVDPTHVWKHIQDEMKSSRLSNEFFSETQLAQNYSLFMLKLICRGPADMNGNEILRLQVLFTVASLRGMKWKAKEVPTAEFGLDGSKMETQKGMKEDRIMLKAR